jgi:hypothetical protein
MADFQPQDQPDEPFRLDPTATEAWRKGVDSDISTGVTSLVGPVDDQSIAGLTAGLRSAQAGKLATDEALSHEFNATAARDRAYRERAFSLEGVAANELPRPWNAEAEHKKWETNPIEGFGSVGGLFAMIASAFTKAPMENAINGMAGAINSIREGNEAGYQRAFDAYKTNVQLADQRFKMQHELYQDALSLGTTDLAVSQAKFHNAAIRFGDRQMLMLMENGMYPQVYEVLDARAKAHEQMMKMDEDIDLHRFRKAAIDSLKMNPPQTGDPVQDKMQLAAQMQRIYDGSGKYGTAEQEAVGRYVQENWRKSLQEFTDGLEKIHEQFSPKFLNIEGYRQAKQAWHDQHPGEQMPDIEDAKLLQQFGLTGVRGAGAAGAGGAALTNQRQIQQDAERHKAQMAAEHPDWGPDKLDQDRDRYVKERLIATTAPTGTILDTLRGKIDRIDNMDHTIDKVEELLKKHKAITGLGGKITRPAEIVSNIFGSNDTDRKQFERYVAELQEWAPAALNDRNGRPLSSEASKIEKIIAGINIGDTAANTARAYAELRPLLKTIKQQLQARGAGGESQTPPAQIEDPKDQGKGWDTMPGIIMNDASPGKQSSASEAPPVDGARKAPDGNWYVDDPDRPGKYLQVMSG